MRSLKGLVIAALVVCSVVAFGASTAGATVVCTSASASTSTPCPSPVPSGTTISGQLRNSTNAVLTTSGGAINPTITCTASTVRVTTTSAGGSGLPVTGSAATGDVTFSSCTSVNPAGCSATITSTSGATGQIVQTAGTLDGVLSLGPPTFPVSCPLRGVPLNCTYGGSGTVSGNTTHGTFGAAGTATIAFTNAPINVQAGTSCPTAARWTATYIVTRIGAATSGSVALTDN